MNKNLYRLSSGAVLILLSVLFLHKGVSVMDLDFEFIAESFSDWSIYTPYLLIGLVSGFFGFNLFFTGLSNVQNSNL